MMGMNAKHQLSDLPSALQARDEIAARLEGKRPVVFLDYDGTLTPIVERPELAILAPEIRAIVRALAQRCTVAVVSGRDRLDVEKLVGVEGLVFAGSHGFDIASPDGRSIQNEVGADFGDLIREVTARAMKELASVEGSLVEPKRSSVALHYRLVAEDEAPKLKAVVDAILADHADLRVTSGKKVWEIQPRIDWNKGKAVLWLLEALNVDQPDVVPFYFGDDVTDEDAFQALKGRGIGVYVGHPDDVEACRGTVADYALRTPDEVGSFLDGLAR
jgi:trehalose 6-phosphate phosphatase